MIIRNRLHKGTALLVYAVDWSARKLGRPYVTYRLAKRSLMAARACTSHGGCYGGTWRRDMAVWRRMPATEPRWHS